MNQYSAQSRDLIVLSPPLYAAAIMLVLVPINQLLGGLNYDLNLEVLTWRTGAVGLLSGAVLTPCLGVLIATVTSVVFGHQRIQQMLMVLAGLGSLLLLVIVFLFGLDAVEVRSDVSAQHRRAFTSALAMAMVSLSVAAATLAVICVSLSRSRSRR